jgi:sugar lactone lactonase YvrE
MKRRFYALLVAPSAALGVLMACGDDGDSATGPKPDSGDITTPDSGAGGDASADRTSDAPLLTPTVVFASDAAAGELVEGVTVVPPDAGGAAAGLPVIGYAPLGKLARVLLDGGTQPHAQFTPAAKNTFTTGLSVDGKGNVYVAVAAAGAGPIPRAGVYKIVAGTSTPVAFSGATNPPMAFANGIDIIGDEMFVTDSAGFIFRFSMLTGLGAVWAKGPDLEGDLAACGSANAFKLGANGITHDDQNIFVVNTDKGALLKIPRLPDAGAGATVLYKNCELAGGDGLVREASGSFLIANNPKNKIQRLSADGTTLTTVSEGAPLDGPASLWWDENVSPRRLYITNSAFGSAAADGGTPRPGLLYLTF